MQPETQFTCIRCLSPRTNLSKTWTGAQLRLRAMHAYRASSVMNHQRGACPD